MEKKFLNEENYQKNSKGVLIAGIIVLVVGVVLGGFLLANGVGGFLGNDKSNETDTTEIEKKVDLIELDISNLNSEIQNIKSDETKISGDIFLLENSIEFLKSSTMSDNTTEINEKTAELALLESDLEEVEELLNSKESELVLLKQEESNLNDELREISSDDFHSESFGRMGGIFSIFGGLVLLGTGLGLGIKLILIAKARSILAYGAQTVVPVANEVMESAAPSIGKVAEEISKGINAGKK